MYPSDPAQSYICPGDGHLAELVTLRFKEGYVQARKQEQMYITDVCTGRHLNWALSVKKDGLMYWVPRRTNKLSCGCRCHPVDTREDKMLGD